MTTLRYKQHAFLWTLLLAVLLTAGNPVVALACAMGGQSTAKATASSNCPAQMRCPATGKQSCDCCRDTHPSVKGTTGDSVLTKAPACVCTVDAPLPAPATTDRAIRIGVSVDLALPVRPVLFVQPVRQPWRSAAPANGPPRDPYFPATPSRAPPAP